MNMASDLFIFIPLRKSVLKALYITRHLTSIDIFDIKSVIGFL